MKRPLLLLVLGSNKLGCTVVILGRTRNLRPAIGITWLILAIRIFWNDMRMLYSFFKHQRDLWLELQNLKSNSTSGVPSPSSSSTTSSSLEFEFDYKLEFQVRVRVSSSSSSPEFEFECVTWSLTSSLANIRVYWMNNYYLLQSATRWYYKVRQLFYYKVRQALLQSETAIAKCGKCYYKVRRYYKSDGTETDELVDGRRDGQTDLSKGIDKGKHEFLNVLFMTLLLRCMATHHSHLVLHCLKPGGQRLDLRV